MSLSSYDAPNGSYTARIPPGTAAYRKVIAEAFGFTRTEVIRDASRCAGKRSEHCECGAVDAFTTDHAKGRAFFDWNVRVSDALGIQSVIFEDREIGFGNPTERHRSKDDHWDHVHVGLNRWARQNLTEDMVRSLLAGGFLMALNDAEQKEVLDLARELPGEVEKLRVLLHAIKNVKADGGLDKRFDAIDKRLAAIEAKL